MKSPAAWTLDRKLTLGVFALLFVSYAYFYQGGGWNENSRMDLVRALVDDHTLTIDRYHENTGDKARFGGHYYSDKAPGLSFMAAPVYFFVRFLRSSFSEHHFLVIATYLVTVFTVGLSSAVLGALLYRASRRLGVTEGPSVTVAIGYGLGTMALPLSTMFFSHQVAALALFGAFYVAWICKERYSTWRSLAVALLCAGAVVLEFPTAPAALIIIFYHVTGAETFAAVNRRRLLMVGAGIAVPALLLMTYLWTSFGSPLSVGYHWLADPASRAEMQTRGLFGVTHPKLHVLMELLLGRYRGLLPYSPILIPALLGFVLMPRRRERGACIAIIVYYLLFVSSYAWWQGGSSFGSRHLAPMLPFWMLPLGYAAQVRPKITGVFLAVSIAFMSIVVSVQPKTGEHLEDPFWSGLLPAFIHGDIAANNICPETGGPELPKHVRLLRTARHDAFNLGMLFRGRGLRSLVPLYTLWLVSGWAFWQATRRKPANEESSGEGPDEHGDRARPLA